MDTPRDLAEKKLLSLVGILASLFGGTMLLMSAGGLVLAAMLPFMGEAEDGLRAAGTAVLALGVSAVCLWGGIALRRLPLTLASMARSAAESVAFMVIAFWSLRITTGQAQALEKICYLLLVSLVFIAGVNRFREPGGRE